MPYRYQKYRITHRRPRSARLLSRFSSLAGSWIKFGGCFTIGAVYVLLLYHLFVAPVNLRWRGLFGTTKYPAGYSIGGIDVSHHQGRIDWEALRHAEAGSRPLSFVFIKATEGEALVDPNFSTNFYQAREHGMLRGAYHFYVPGVPIARQIALFTRTVPLETGDLPPVLDIERTGSLSPEQLRSDVLCFLRAMEQRYGVRPILYTYYKFRRDYLNTPPFERYPYWIAHYYVDEVDANYRWKFWQHTDRGRLSGIRGYVDLNVYNGSLYDLQQLCLK